jgi:hypothetical protein
MTGTASLLEPPGALQVPSDACAGFGVGVGDPDFGCFFSAAGFGVGAGVGAGVGFAISGSFGSSAFLSDCFGMSGLPCSFKQNSMPLFALTSCVWGHVDDPLA